MNRCPQLKENVENLTGITAELTLFYLLKKWLRGNHWIYLLFTGFSYFSTERSSNSWVGVIKKGSVLLTHSK